MKSTWPGSLIWSASTVVAFDQWYARTVGVQCLLVFLSTVILYGIQFEFEAVVGSEICSCTVCIFGPCYSYPNLCVLLPGHNENL
jgi:hypothetical protein